ncbi:MAG TPA: hypothetical protein VH253_10430 [Phycisphaerae bacterium]|nr:hypothetical protein [Phycisphaerae bacterium]
MRRIVGWAVVLGVVAAAVCEGAGPATRPFTVGAETTVISGPMWDDGTLDYVGAINARLSKGVTAENNAAVVLLGVFAPVGKTKEELAALGVKGGALVPAMKSLEDYAREQHLDIDIDVLGDREMEARRRPWTEKEFPVIAAWLDANKAGLARIKVGVERPRFYLPWVAEHGRGDVLSAIPLQADVSQERDAVLCEAMRLAGAKDVAGALLDLREVRKLGALQVQGRTELAVLEGAAAARAAWTAYAGMVTKMDLTDEQLAAVGRELEDRTIDLPERPVIDVEYLLAPGTVMSCIGGQEETFLRIEAMGILPGDQVDPGDLASADWDTVLKTVHAKTAAIEAAEDLPTFAERQAALEKIPAARPPFDAATLDEIEMGTGTAKRKEAVEAFLKRKAGESVEAYSVRVSDMFGLLPEQVRSYNRVLEAREVQRKIVLLAVRLEQYRRKNGAFPMGLKDQGATVDTSDPLSGQSLIYSPANGGYTLKSVGVNGKDDGGTDVASDKDDIVIRAGKRE